MAAELTRRANLAVGHDLETQLRLMADEWTRLSVMADWQDRLRFIFRGA